MIVPFSSVLMLDIHIQVCICLHLVWRVIAIDGVERLVASRNHFSSVVERETEVILEVNRLDGYDLLFNDYIVVVGWLGMMVM